jgi:CrcB protein
VQYRRPGLFPRGTWLINITGAYVLGAAGLAIGSF